MPRVGDARTVMTTGLPLGGYPGQPLVKNTAAQYDTSWQQPAVTPGSPVFSSDRWYSNLLTATSWGASMLNAPVGCVLSGLWLPQPLLITGLATMSGGATVAGNLVLGAWSAKWVNGVMTPDVSLGFGRTFQNANTTTYFVDLTASPIALPGGWSWLMCGFDGGAWTYAAMQSSPGMRSPHAGSAPLNQPVPTVPSSVNTGWFCTTAPPAAGATFTRTTAQVQPPAVMLFRPA